MPDDGNARPIFLPEIEQLGGAERSLLALGRWLHGRGLPHYLLTYRDHCNVAQYADYPFNVVDLRVHGGVRAKVAALRRHFAARSASAPAILASGYQPALHLTLAGQRGFHDLMHDTPALFGDERTRSWRSKLRIGVSSVIAGFGLRSGGRTIVTSEFLRAECRKDFGVDAEIARMGGLSGAPAATRDVRAPGAPLHMLSVCRIEANKRIDWLLRALARLEAEAVPPLTAPLSSLVPWQLDLAGKGSQIAPLTELARTLGLGARVHFHGFVSDADLETVYARADLFLMPAVQGYGIPAVEALARSIPVLLHRESGVSDILLDTPWATVLLGGEENTASALALAVDRILGGAHSGVPAPTLPTEDEWAERVATLCGWA